MSNSPSRRARRSAAPATRGQRPKRPNLVLPIVLGLVALLAIVAVVVSAADSDDDTDGGAGGTAQTRSVEIAGPALTDFGDGNDPAVGAGAPVVRGSSFDGEPVVVGAAGEPQLLFFLAHWCPHCQAEVPVITEWIEEEGPPEGVALKAVSTGVNESAPNYPPSSWLEREGWPVETLVDDEDSAVGQAYGLTSYPYFVAIDGDGKVVARASGELGIDRIEALVEAARG